MERNGYFGNAKWQYIELKIAFSTWKSWFSLCCFFLVLAFVSSATFEIDALFAQIEDKVVRDTPSSIDKSVSVLTPLFSIAVNKCNFSAAVNAFRLFELTGGIFVEK